ncbi:MAG: HAD family hydrolase [Anaeroplasma sp.]
MAAILFDLYGTLVNIKTDENRNVFWKRFCNKTKKYKSYNYMDLKKKYLSLCEEFEQNDEEIEIMDVFSKLYPYSKNKLSYIALLFRRLSRKYYKLYPGVKKLLNSLKQNHNIYLLSNAQASFTINELKQLGIYNLFDGIAISSEYKMKKPNEEFFKKAIMNFNITTEDIWMVGNDFQCDILPAKNLNLKTIFIKSNLTPINQYDETGLYGFDYKIILEIINEQKNLKN